jgi:EamA domain-containing membrane protein RarD
MTLELFSVRAAVACYVWGGVFLYFVLAGDPVQDIVSVRVLQVVALLHCLLLVRAVKCRQKWRFDVASYLDFTCLLSGIIVGPIYCLVRNRRLRTVNRPDGHRSCF